MSSSIELIVLVFAILAVGYLAWDLFQHRLRERREKDLLDRLSGEEPTIIAAPREPSAIERRLQAAGLRGPAEAYVFGASLLAVLVSILVLRVLPSLPLVALMAFGCALYLPWAAVKELADSRSRKFERLLIEAIDLMAGALFAGGNLTQSFQSAGSVAEEPVRGEFHEVERRLALGMPLPRALGRMQESFDGEGVRLFTQTLAAKNQAGGDLAPVLKSLNETMRDRWRQQRQVQAQMSGAKVSAIAVAVLPYVFAPVLVWMKADWFRSLFGHPLGPPLLFLAVMLQLIGLLWVWRILSREL